MPPASRSSARGRRDPSLLAAEQAAEQATQDLPDDEDEPDDGFEPDIVLLYEGETVTSHISVPVTLGGMDRYSIVQAEVHCTVQNGEPDQITAARARAMARQQFFAQVQEMEEELRIYAEQEAERETRLNRAVSARRTNS